MEAWIDQIFSIVDPHWIPWIVFGLLMLSGFGIPLGEDVIIIPAGMLVGYGDLHWLPIFIGAYFGVVFADILWFTICSIFGTRLAHMRWFKRLMHPKRMLQVKYQLDNRGVWMIVLARFIPASRTTAITVAGMLHMHFWKFVIATVVCVMFTVPAQLFAGWWIAKSLQAESMIELLLRLVGLVVVVLAVIWGYRLWSSHQKSGKETPRAHASWFKYFRPKKK